MRLNRRGFTLIEMLIVVVIISILARVAVPKVRAMHQQAKAAKIVGDLKLIITAAYSYQATTNNWPPSSGWGVIPVGLAPYLPTGFTFSPTDYKLSWQVVSSGGAKPVIYGISQVQVVDALICPKVTGLLGGARNAALSSSCPSSVAGLFVDR